MPSFRATGAADFLLPEGRLARALFTWNTAPKYQSWVVRGALGLSICHLRPVREVAGGCWKGS